MNAGDLDQRIVLERRTVERDAAGQAIEKFLPLASVRAAVRPISGREDFTASQRFAEAEVRFVLRYRKDVTPVDRVVHAGRAYDVLEVLAFPGGRPERLEILARARAE